MSPRSITLAERAGDAFGDALPRFLGALLLIVVGLLVVRILARLLERALEAAGLDDRAEQWRVHDHLERAGLARSLTSVTGTALRLGLTLVVLFAALSLLGLAALDQSLNQGVLFLPRLVAALVLLLIGMVLGGFAREWVERLAGQMELPASLGAVAQASIISVFGVTALAQVGVPTIVLAVVAGVVASAGALTFALAFGLGSREVARQASAGRYVTSAFHVGQRIGVGGVSGEIQAIETASTVLRTDRGGIVRVPNHLLLESVVTVAEPAPEGPGGTVPAA